MTAAEATAAGPRHRAPAPDGAGKQEARKARRRTPTRSGAAPAGEAAPGEAEARQARHRSPTRSGAAPVGEAEARQAQHRAPTRSGAAPAGEAASPARAEARQAQHRAPTRSGAAPAGEAAVTEEQLVRLWRGQRFPAGALVTRQGVPVTVIHQGRVGRGPGPDFRGAVIAGPSGVPLRGDVELHVRASSFRAHGHHADAAYAGVVLHVVFEDDTGGDTPLPGGGSAPVVALAPWVARRSRELARWLEQPLLWREPCHDAVVRMGAEGAGAALDGEGERRFAAKVQRMAAAMRAEGTEEAVYGGLLEALGYGGNAAPMRALAGLLPWRRLGTALPGGRGLLEAWLLGSAGLLPSQRGGGAGASAEPHVAALEAAWAAARLPSLTAGAWKTWGVRPENAPARRLAGAAALLARAGSPAALLEAADTEGADAAVVPLLIAAEGYWLRHHDAGAAACRLPAAFIGRSRALEIVVNVLLPAACASGGPERAARARALFARLPRPAAYGATRFIEEALASGGERVAVGARRAQGLLALQRDWCGAGGCGRCPLSPSRGGT